MTIDELNQKIQDLLDEMRDNHKSISASQFTLTQRLDSLDLNGAASDLRNFGYFLRDHPDFMKREAESESKRVQKEVAMKWIAETFHLTDMRKKAAWALTALLTGILLTFGNSIVGILSDANSLFHSFGHTMFR